MASLLARPTLEQLQNKQTEINNWNSKFKEKENRVNNLQQELDKVKWTEDWRGFNFYLKEILGVREVGNNTLNTVFDKAFGKYVYLETSFAWLYFWKAIENTVSETPDFRQWSGKWDGSWFTVGTGTGYYTVNRAGTGTRTYSGTWSGTYSGIKVRTTNINTIGTGPVGGIEVALPTYEANKSFFDIIRSKHEILLFFEPNQLTQFNQILEDFRKYVRGKKAERTT